LAAFRRATPPSILGGDGPRIEASLVLPKDVPFHEGAREALVARPESYVASA